MSINLTNYKRATCCDADCYGSDQYEPCWGKVEFIGEEFDSDDTGKSIVVYQIHLCEGHLNWPKEYKKENESK